MKIIVIGGAGFIGSVYARMAAQDLGNHVVVVDAMTYAGRRSRLDPELGAGKIEFVELDASDPDLAPILDGAGAVVNFAAETSVDRTNNAAHYLDLVRSNVAVVANVLSIMHSTGSQAWFHQVSTDEVYGPSSTPCQESSGLNPTNAYSSTKAGAEALALAHARVHNARVSVSRACNTVGAGQDEEKLVPLVIKKALTGQKIPVYGSGHQRREWIHVRDHARAIDHIIRNGLDGVWNVSTGQSLSNAYMIELVCAHVDSLFERSSCLRSAFPACLANARHSSASLIEHVHDRPGHDFEYRVDPSKLVATGWSCQDTIDVALAEAVSWASANLSADSAGMVKGL